MLVMFHGVSYNHTRLCPVRYGIGYKTYPRMSLQLHVDVGCCRCMQISGKEGEELIVSGAWLIRGQSMQPLMDANDDANW